MSSRRRDRRKGRRFSEAAVQSQGQGELAGKDGAVKEVERGKRLRPLMIILLLLVFAGVPFSLGKFFEFNMPGAFDSGAYVYSAEHVLEGAKIGVDERPSAKVGTLLVNMLGVWVFGFNDVGPKVVQMFLQLGALAVMFFAVRRVFGDSAAVVSVVLGAVYLSAPHIAKYGNVKEQYMIAFMVMGVGFYILAASSGSYLLALIAGAALSWGPLFKETGVSAIAAVGAFVVVEAVFRLRDWRRAAAIAGCLVGGGVLAIAPVYVWFAVDDVRMSTPYEKIFSILGRNVSEAVDSTGEFFVNDDEGQGGGDLDESGVDGEADAVAAGGEDGVKEDKSGGGYIAGARKIFDISKQAPIVGRYYMSLILPISMAGAAVLIWSVRLAAGLRKKLKFETDVEKFVFLLGVWWALDMAFVWISPRSYEQYYLPLTASGAMTGGYLLWLYTSRLRGRAALPVWVGVGAAGLLAAVIMVCPIVFGISKSPHWGSVYTGRDGKPEKRRGYVQRFEEVTGKLKGAIYPWERVGEFIRANSNEDDSIYVWGWVPGVYVKAGRLAPVPDAFEGDMHNRSPESLGRLIRDIVSGFEARAPKFIVDTRKRHFPWDRPPLELWPILPKGFMGAERAGFLPDRAELVEFYENVWGKYLKEEVGNREDERFEAMKPLRDFVMNNYRVVLVDGPFVVFEKKGGV